MATKTRGPYDKEDTEKDFMDVIDRSISEDEKSAMEERAFSGAVEDIREGANADREFNRDGSPKNTHTKKPQGDGSDEDFLNVADDEKRALESRGFLVQNVSEKKKAGLVKKYAKKRALIILSGVGISVGGSLLGFIFSILPFELQHVKNVFETEIGGVRDTVLQTRRGRLLSRAFFFHQDADGVSRFDGYRQRGMVATLSGQNFRSSRLLDDMRARGFQVEVHTDANGRFSGRLQSINGNNVNIENGQAFRDTWRSRAAGRTEIRKFFDDSYPDKSAFWRARKSRDVYQRYRLGSLRGNWFADASVRQASNIRMKLRQALYGESRNASPTGVRSETTTAGQDADGNATNNPVDTSSEFGQQATERRQTLLSTDEIFRKPDPGDVARRAAAAAAQPGTVARAGARSLSIFGALGTACDAKRVLNTIVVGSRILRSGALAAYATAFLSVADITLTGDLDAQDVGAFTDLLRRENPVTGRAFFGSGSWQWASTGQGTVNGDIRSEYSVGGGLTGTLGDLNNTVDGLLLGQVGRCNIVNNVFVQIAGGVVGAVAAFFTGGGSAAAQIALGAAAAVAFAIIEAIAVPMIIDMVAGTVIHGDEYGDEIAAAVVSGYVGLLGLQGTNHGFKPVTNTQLAVLTKERDRNIAAQQADMSIFERYLSPKNHRSLTSTAAIYMPTSLKSGLSTLSNLLLNPLSLVASPMGVITSDNSYVAAQGVDGGQCQDEDIVNHNLASDPFCNLIYAQDIPTLAVDPVENLGWMIDNGYVDEDGAPTNSENGQSYREYLDKCVNLFDVIHDKEDEYSSEFTDECYTSNIVAHADGRLEELSEEDHLARQSKVYDFDDLYVAYAIQDGDFDPTQNYAESGKVYAQGSTGDGEELANLSPTIIERFNALRLDEVLLDSLAEEFTGDFAQPSGSLEPAGPADAIVGDPYESSVDIACDSRTVDVGVHEAFVEGVPVQMRLCALPNLSSNGQESIPGNQYYVSGPDGEAEGHAIVNSRVAGAWYSLVEAAANNPGSPVNLSASSSFRTNAHQQDLWVQHGMDTALVAPPGTSSHQAGVAIDFSDMGFSGTPGQTYVPGATCSNRATFDGENYQWLRANASRFGFLQYAGESWHWDALPVSNRC